MLSINVSNSEARNDFSYRSHGCKPRCQCNATKDISISFYNGEGNKLRPLLFPKFYHTLLRTVGNIILHLLSNVYPFRLNLWQSFTRMACRSVGCDWMSSFGCWRSSLSRGSSYKNSTTISRGTWRGAKHIILERRGRRYKLTRCPCHCIRNHPREVFFENVYSLNQLTLI